MARGINTIMVEISEKQRVIDQYRERIRKYEREREEEREQKQRIWNSEYPGVVPYSYYGDMYELYTGFISRDKMEIVKVQEQINVLKKELALAEQK